MGLIDDSILYIEHRAACEKIKQTIRERQEKREQDIQASARVVPGSFIIPGVEGRARSVFYALGPELVPIPPTKARHRRG
jgi:hypothetical protein